MLSDDGLADLQVTAEGINALHRKAATAAAAAAAAAALQAPSCPAYVADRIGLAQHPTLLRSAT